MVPEQSTDEPVATNVAPPSGSVIVTFGAGEPASFDTMIVYVTLAPVKTVAALADLATVRPGQSTLCVFVRLLLARFGSAAIVASLALSRTDPVLVLEPHVFAVALIVTVTELFAGMARLVQVTLPGRKEQPESTPVNVMPAAAVSDTSTLCGAASGLLMMMAYVPVSPTFAMPVTFFVAEMSTEARQFTLKPATVVGFPVPRRTNVGPVFAIWFSTVVGGTLSASTDEPEPESTAKSTSARIVEPAVAHVNTTLATGSTAVAPATQPAVTPLVPAGADAHAVAGAVQLVQSVSRFVWAPRVRTPVFQARRYWAPLGAEAASVVIATCALKELPTAKLTLAVLVPTQVGVALAVQVPEFVIVISLGSVAWFARATCADPKTLRPSTIAAIAIANPAANRDRCLVSIIRT